MFPFINRTLAIDTRTLADNSRSTNHYLGHIRGDVTLNIRTVDARNSFGRNRFWHFGGFCRSPESRHAKIVARGKAGRATSGLVVAGSIGGVAWIGGGGVASVAAVCERDGCRSVGVAIC